MKFFDLVSLIIDNLGRRKGRVALTAIGVVIGTAAVVVLVSLGIGLQQSATSQLYGIGDLTKIDVYANYSDMAAGGGPASSNGNKPSQVKQITPQVISDISNLSGVKQVIATDFVQGQSTLTFGQFEGWAGISGVDITDVSELSLKVQDGETTLRKGTAIIGSWVPNSFYNPKKAGPQEKLDLMGKRLTLTLTKYTQDGQSTTKKIPITVVGILEETRGEADNSIYMMLDEVTSYNEWFTGKRINRNKDGFNRAIVRAASADKVLEISQAINDMGFRASSPQDYVQGINSFFNILQMVFGGIGAISLLVAAIGIANTMTMAILERTREIGLMKAVGASNRNVLSIFLGEAAGIGFIGGLGGVILGWGAGKLVNVVGTTFLSQSLDSMGGGTLAAVTPVWLAAFALLFSVIVGLLSGLYPALRAATLEPMIALKYE